MSTVFTIVQLGHYAYRGVSWQDKWLAFLVAGLGALGAHRIKLRLWFLKQINTWGNQEDIQVCLSENGKFSYICMRRGNEADYLMAGEFVRGSYEVPNFAPRTIIDGGANIGVFAIHAANHFPTAKLVCYEPDLANFEQLQKNLTLNELQAEIHQVGLWSKNTTLYYHPHASHLGFVDEQPPGISIPCVLPEIEADCWLKLDIEGAEYEVLPALLKYGKYPRWISLEVHYFDTKGQALMSLLREHDYEIKGNQDPSLHCTVISAYRELNNT